MTQTSDFRLPAEVLPKAYRLTLEPDLGALNFRGEVAIDLDVRRPTREVVLHAADLDILEARIDGRRADVRIDAARDRATVTADGPLSGAAVLTLTFTGMLHEEMRGFYRSTYTRADGSQAFMATTQFEATNARRCFPCFDEPALKATFDVTLVIPGDRTAVSNMPVTSDTRDPDGRRRLAFARTPVMSTYLLAFVVGELESLEGKTRDGVPVRVYATPGRAHLCRFALETAIRGLEWFDEYYGIPYSKALPKCDLLAIPDFEFGAMENWGAITFRETAIFVDPEKSSIPQRRRVAEVVLHELAHQWFGNLVTPEWWSFLWLNESFATYMAYKAADALFPEWKIWEEYLSQITAAGKSLDSLRSSHPVEVVVRDSSEVDQIFDAISYNKGGSVLRMLEHAVGAEAFRDGIRRYLRDHAYAAATTDDLWKALGDGAAMMDGWTRRVGLPVVVVRRDGPSLKVRQERFLIDRDPKAAAEDPTTWDIPLPARDASGRVQTNRLKEREGALDVSSAGWVKLNAGQSGFYLTHYDEEGWAALAKAVETMALGPLDRFGLQEDAYSLMRAGYLSVPGYLALAGAYGREENHHVWIGVIDGLGALADIFVGDPHVPKLEAWARRLVKPALERVGLDEKKDDPGDRLLLRATLLGAAVRFGEPDAVASVRQRFEALKKDVAAVGPNLRSTVLWGAARHGDEKVLDDLIALHGKADLPEVKVQALRAMGAFRAEAPLRRAVAYGLSERVRRQDAMAVFAGVPIETKPAAWGLLKEHWSTLDERYGKSGLIGRFIGAAAGSIPSEAHAADVEAFFRDHPAPYGTETIKQTLEGIRARAKFRERNRAGLAEFFDGQNRA